MMSEALRTLCMPQMEQLGMELRESGPGLSGSVRSETCMGTAWAGAVGPDCLVLQQRVTLLCDLPFVETSVSDYACACVVGADVAPAMPSFVSCPQALGAGTAFTFLQPAGSSSFVLKKGMTYRSRSICLLPGYFDRLEREWPGEFAGLFEAFARPWSPAARQVILSALHEVGPSGRAGDGLRLSARVEQMAAGLAACEREGARAQAQAGSHESVALAAQACAYVDRHLGEPLTLDEVARALFVGRTRLCSVFRAECGRGLAEHVRARRMERACELLATTGLSVAEVARSVGYPRATSFSAAFAREVGEAPGVWRIRAR